jgi:hypothetical protein
MMDCGRIDEVLRAVSKPSVSVSFVALVVSAPGLCSSTLETGLVCSSGVTFASVDISRYLVFVVDAYGREILDGLLKWEPARPANEASEIRARGKKG